MLIDPYTTKRRWRAIRGAQHEAAGKDRAEIAAPSDGEAFLAGQIERCRRSRDILSEGLSSTGRVRFFGPEAEFYVFCAVDGFADPRALALRLVDEAGVGSAPGAAPSAPAARGISASASPAIQARSKRRRGAWRDG